MKYSPEQRLLTSIDWDINGLSISKTGLPATSNISILSASFSRNVILKLPLLGFGEIW
jgi:hypothetical protein